MILLRIAEKCILGLILVMGLFGFSTSFAQETSFSRMKMSTPALTDSSTLQEKAPGELFIQAFQDSKPVAGLQVLIASKSYQTSSNGSLLVDLPEGTHEVTLPQAQKIIVVEIQKNLETFVRLNVASINDKIPELSQIQSEIETPKLALMSSEELQKIQSQIQNNPKEEIEEYVVLAPQNKVSVAALIQVRKKSSGVAEVLGAEQMSRQGDGDAASSLRRVTGLTLMGGKFVYVRGLGERYSAVQLNGFSLPSPEPTRKVVPLDLFPTSVLESVLVQKSYQAFFPGEFGGGLIQLNTKSLPPGFLAQIAISQTYAEMDEMKTYAGGGSDWTGKDDGTRAMPRVIRNALASGRRLTESTPGQPGFSRDELKAMGESLPRNYNLKEGSTWALPSMQMALGNKWQFGGNSLGTMASLSYNNSMEVEDRRIQQVDVVGSDGQIAVTESGSFQEYEVERRLSATWDLGFDIENDHQFRALLMGLRHNTDLAVTQEVSGTGVNDFARRKTRTEWVERDMVVGQLKGSHRLGGTKEKPLSLDWRAGRSQAQRNSPDMKEYAYRKIGPQDPFRLDPEVSGNLRTYNELQDQSDEWGLDLTLPFEIQKAGSIQWKLGFSDTRRVRDADTFRLQFIKDYLAGEEPDLTRTPDEIFADQTKWRLVNQTQSADSYRGQSSIQALATSALWQPSAQWEGSVGYRLEEATNDVATFFYFNPDDIQSRGTNTARNLLPSYSLVWKPNDVVRARLAYGESVARPDFRELSTVRYIDNETGFEAKGNTELLPTVIRHVDHRWEYYFKEDEYVSFGVFYKQFENPIEDVFQPAAGSLIKVPQNALRAENRGAEFESRVSLRRLNRELRRWSLVANYSWIQSEVELDPRKTANLTTRNRPLQGQSPYVVNIQLQYDRPAQGTQAALLYNVLGPRITEVGTDQRPDIYEQPFHQVDFVLNQKFQKNWQWQFRARNLLDPEIRATQGKEVARASLRGRFYSMGATWTF